MTLWQCFHPKTYVLDSCCLPQGAGVYVVYSKDNSRSVLYVGSSRRLATRLKQHIKNGIWCFPLGQIKVKVCKRFGSWLELEARLIYRLQPTCNCQLKRPPHYKKPPKIIRCCERLLAKFGQHDYYDTPTIDEKMPDLLELFYKCGLPYNQRGRVIDYLKTAVEEDNENGFLARYGYWVHSDYGERDTRGQRPVYWMLYKHAETTN